jgi:hypothetical protein
MKFRSTLKAVLVSAGILLGAPMANVSHASGFGFFVAGPTVGIFSQPRCETVYVSSAPVVYAQPVVVAAPAPVVVSAPPPATVVYAAPPPPPAVVYYLAPVGYYCSGPAYVGPRHFVGYYSHGHSHYHHRR